MKRIVALLAAALLVLAGWFGVRIFLDRYIPPADRSDIGKVIAVSLPELQASIPYEGVLDPEGMDHLSFIYVYDGRKNSGRLTVFTRCTDERYCCVTVYEPEWQGSEALCENLTGSFQAKVIARKNITSKEGLMLVHNITKYTGGTETFIHAASHKEIGGSGVLWYMGVLDPTPQSRLWDTLDNGLCVSIKVAGEENSNVNALMNILNRYKLDKAVIPEA